MGSGHAREFKLKEMNGKVVSQLHLDFLSLELGGIGCYIVGTPLIFSTLIL